MQSDHLCEKISVIVRRRSLRAAEYETVVARLLRTASTGLSSRLLSSDALGRELIVRERVSRSRSDSDPDNDDMETLAGDARETPSSAKAECIDTFRLLELLSCCC